MAFIIMGKIPGRPQQMQYDTDMSPQDSQIFIENFGFRRGYISIVKRLEIMKSQFQ